MSQEASRIRSLGLVLLAAFIVFSLALVSVPLLIRDPLPVLRPDSSIVLPADDVSTNVSAQLQINRAGDFALVLELAGDAGDPPRVAFEMPDHQMQAIEAEMARIGERRYHGEGRLHAPGRWRMLIEEGTEAHHFEFTLAEF